MTLSFKVLEQPDATVISSILDIEQQARSATAP